MAFVLVVVGLLMIITGARGTYQQFGSQVASDFTGPGNFTYWLAAIGIIGAIGYIEPLKTVSRLFMALVLIGMVLSNRGVFAKFQAAMKAGPAAPQAPSTATQGGASGVTTQSGSAPTGIIDNWISNSGMPDWLKGLLNAPVPSMVRPG